jgi:hypothetical protein
MEAKKRVSQNPTPKPATAKSPPAQSAAKITNGNRDDEPRRLLREAAWLRMFGHNEMRNPFAR